MSKLLWLGTGISALTIVALVVLYLGSDSDEFLAVQTARVGQGEVVVMSDCGFSGDECSYAVGVRLHSAAPFRLLWRSEEVNDTPKIAVGGDDEIICVQVERWDYGNNQKLGDFWCAWHDLIQDKARLRRSPIYAHFQPQLKLVYARLAARWGANSKFTN